MARSAPGGSGTEQLRFRARPQLRRNRANKTRLQSQLQKHAANFAKSDRRLIELEINNVVVAIDLVAEAGDGFELMIELENFIQIAHAGRVDFEFDHECCREV